MVQVEQDFDDIQSKASSNQRRVNEEQPRQNQSEAEVRQLELAESEAEVGEKVAHWLANNRSTHLLTESSSGISNFHFSLASHHRADGLVKRLLRNKIVAEVTSKDAHTNKTTLGTADDPRDQTQTDSVEVEGVTSDDRVPELVEIVTAVQQKQSKSVSDKDIVVLPVLTGSQEYISWVRNTTDKSGLHHSTSKTNTASLAQGAAHTS